MYMFTSIFDRIPKNRSELVNDLDTSDLSLSPHVSVDSEDSSLDRLEVESVGSSESSLAFSRVLPDTDSEYHFDRPLKRRVASDDWALMKAALDAFPADYLDSMNSYIPPSPLASLEEKLCERESLYERERLQQLRDLELKMLKFFEEEVRVFEPEDPGLADLERALEGLDLKETDSESSSL